MKEWWHNSLYFGIAGGHVHQKIPPKKKRSFSQFQRRLRGETSHQPNNEKTLRHDLNQENHTKLLLISINFTPQNQPQLPKQMVVLCFPGTLWISAILFCFFFWSFEKSAICKPPWFGIPSRFKILRLVKNLPHPRCLTCSTVSRPMCPHDRDGRSDRVLATCEPKIEKINTKTVQIRGPA